MNTPIEDLFALAKEALMPIVWTEKKARQKFKEAATPERVLEVAEAFQVLEHRLLVAEQGEKTFEDGFCSVRQDRDEWKQRAESAEAIVADVEEVINLLAEREWAEHCTKTDTGKRLEEVITELHDEAAPAVSLAELVPDELIVEPFKHSVEWQQRHEDRANGFNLCRAAILRNIEEVK